MAEKINYTGNKLEADCYLRKIRFYSEDTNFGIAEFQVYKSTNGLLAEHFTFTCKGRMSRPKENILYTIKANEIIDPKWGLQYELTSMYTPVDMSITENINNFMLQVLTERELEATYKVYDNPYKVWDEGDIEKLTKISGIGIKTAVRKLAEFKKVKAFQKVYVELADFNLTESMVKRLEDAYGDNPDLIISIIKENPYIMAQNVYGIGFKKCDKIALDGGMEPNNPKRISAFIRFYLTECNNNGLSWITADHLLGGIIDNLGEDVKDEAITEAIHNIDKELWYSEDHSRIGLLRYYNTEHKIAEELYRLQTAESRVKNDNWIDSVRRIERLNGWEFTDEQLKAVEIGINNNVFVLTGLAGAGKSSSVQAILEANKGVKVLQTALSGRAASRLFEITKQDGQTIHRALGFPKGPKEHGGFTFHEKNKLDVDIVVVDEVSMIGGDLFYSLIRAIPNGAKLILLGDTGQLPSIGSANVLNDIIASGEIPAINLTKIHRQAAKSAIVTESLKVRNGEQIIPKDWAGKETRGELQDLNIECYSDKSNTFYQVMERFTYEMCQPGFDIMECQIITPIKTRGDSCSQKMNLALQEMYNPAINGVKECKVLKNGYPTIFRVGDKVINTKNNYYTRNIEGDNCPVYNGSIGIIKEIDKYGSMIVDFAYIGQVRLNRYGDKGDERDGLELGYAITVHKCVTADTWIYTNKGLKTIKELDNGALPYEFKEVDKDISIYNGEYFETPSHFYNAGISECRKVTTKRGYQLTGTLDHGLDAITTDGIIVRKDIGELTKEDYLLIRKGQGAYGTSIDIPSSWLTFSFNTRAKKYTLPTIMTEDFAYFLGGMMADGVIYKSGFRYVKNQIDPAVKMSNIIYKIFGFEPSVSRTNTEFDGWYQVEVNSTYLRAFLKNVDGIQPNNKFVPQCILNAPKEIQTAFLKGAFEDGSVNLKNGKFDHIEFSQNGDGKVIKQIRMMLLNLGIVSSYKVIYSKKKNHKDKYVLYIYRKDAIIFRKEIGFTSKNKKSSLDKCMAKDIKTCSQNYLPLLKQVERLLIELKVDPRSINKNLPHYFKKGKTITDNMVESVLSYLEKNVNNSTENEMYKYINMILTNYHVESIIDIESCTEQTYCLTMPETHRFIQNGIQGWNCQGSEFKTLIFAFDFNSYALLSKEMIYTAITRAKKMCYIICQNGALRYATAQNGIAQKQTFLQECLHDVFHPKLVF